MSSIPFEAISNIEPENLEKNIDLQKSIYFTVCNSVKNSSFVDDCSRINPNPSIALTGEDTFTKYGTFMIKDPNHIYFFERTLDNEVVTEDGTYLIDNSRCNDFLQKDGKKQRKNRLNALKLDYQIYVQNNMDFIKELGSEMLFNKKLLRIKKTKGSLVEYYNKENGNWEIYHEKGKYLTLNKILK